jgi:starvation-inducible DNA-binding protein
LEYASLGEHPGDVPMATQMVSMLCEDHEMVIRNMREHIDACSESFHDQGTADFLTGLMEQHEKIAWMLRSFVEGDAIAANGSRPELAEKSPVAV